MSMNHSGKHTFFYIFGLFCAALFVYGCNSGRDGGQGALKLDTEYQAVLLDNGQAYFGKVEQTGGDFIRLKDVFYIQSRVDKDKKLTANVLIKRGAQEWHSPDSMLINSKHVIFMEPVSPSSKVGQLIKEEKSKEGKK
ncbi:MAG: hypothetical protein HY886_05210 [Deltaproteobacteria bacterium]|nr:hypothetical protein [Deltaproteobacteria bacterium]